MKNLFLFFLIQFFLLSCENEGNVSRKEEKKIESAVKKHIKNNMGDRYYTTDFYDFQEVFIPLEESKLYKNYSRQLENAIDETQKKYYENLLVELKERYSQPTFQVLSSLVKRENGYEQIHLFILNSSYEVLYRELVLF